MTRTMIFDLDGTLADTSGDLIAAANAALAQAGHPPLLDPVADAATAFAGGRAMIRLGLSRTGGQWDESHVDAFYPVLLEAYAAKIDVHTTLYPGVEGALDNLEDMGVITGVCTNKPEGLAVTLLQKLGLLGRFPGGVIGADTLPERKPHPLPLHTSIQRCGGTPGRSILLGDTVTDRECARNAGVISALVTFGPTGQKVAELQPEALINSFTELPALVAHFLPEL